MDQNKSPLFFFHRVKPGPRVQKWRGGELRNWSNGGLERWGDGGSNKENTCGGWLFFQHPSPPSLHFSSSRSRLGSSPYTRLRVHGFILSQTMLSMKKIGVLLVDDHTVVRQ